MLVNPDWNFVFLKVEESFLKDMLGEKLDKPMPYVDLWVKRTTAQGEVPVGKVRLLQYRPSQKVVVADVLPQWLQLPLQKGDVVFF
jgi:hypothetical protein